MDAFLDYSQITEEDWVANFKFHYMLPGAKEAAALDEQVLQ